jgi:hypothetical protein
VHCGEVECAAVVAGVLVLSGGQPALFDLAEVALDDDAVGVAAGVQADRVAAGTASPASVDLLVAGFGDGAAAVLQCLVGPAAVTLVATGHSWR